MTMKQDEDQKIIASAQIYVSGHVQGVGFRKFSQACAAKLHLSGTVRNCPDGRVALKVEGTRERIEALISNLHQGPSRSRVDAVNVSWDIISTRLSTFSITD